MAVGYKNVPFAWEVGVIFAFLALKVVPRVKNARLSSRNSLTRRFFDLELWVSGKANTYGQSSQAEPAYVAVRQGFILERIGTVGTHHTIKTSGRLGKDWSMLVLSRKKNESIVINNDIKIVVVEIRGDKVRLGVEAPREVPVHRREVYDAIQRSLESGDAPVES
jgi:carbon storage regulator